MKEFFPRDEFKRLGFSEPAIRIFERLTDIKEIGTRTAAMEEVLKRIQPVTKEAVDAATAAAVASMPDISTISINADYTGAIEAGQLPRNVMAKRYSDNQDVTTKSAWTATTISGTITYTIGAATGVLNITALSSSSVVQIISNHNGVSLSKRVSVNKVVAAAPSTGSGGGTSATDTTFLSFNSTTHATVSDVLTVTTGAIGQVVLSAPLEVSTIAEAPTSTGLDVKGIWQWDNAGVWTDLGTETSSNPDAVVEYDPDTATYTGFVGNISVSHTKTGLAASSSQKFRLNSRNNSGTRTMYLYGTASAVGS